MDAPLSRFAAQYTAKKAVLSLLGAFRLYGPDGDLRFFVKQKAFRLKAELVVYAEEAQTNAVLGIKARNKIDFAATYDVTDRATGQRVGALKRQGFKSMFRDEWTILDADNEEIGKVVEDSGALALIRRYVMNLIPQRFSVTVRGEEVGRIEQAFNPFILTYKVDFSSPRASALDPRLQVAAVVLLLAIEGRQG